MLGHFKGNLAHNSMPHCLLYLSSHLDMIKPFKTINTENIGLIQSCRGKTIKFVNPPKSGLSNESPCDVIKLGISFIRNLYFLWRKINFSEHKEEEDLAVMRMKVPYSI